MTKEHIPNETKDEYRKILLDALAFNREKVVILNAEPSSRAFVIWFMISSYFPVLTACLGPIANMIAVAGIVDKWRMDSDGNTIQDARGVYGVNVASLVLGCISNFVLLLHFSKKVSYVTAQIINIVGWSMAGCMLVIDLIVCAKVDYSGDLHKTTGFWYATLSAMLYIGCTALLLIHYGGYKKKKYPATFNLTDSERNVMIFTFILSLWFIWGAAIFSQIISLSYGEALYYCVVVILTIGLGDLLPLTVAARIMTLIYALSGLIILGVIVALTRSIIESSSDPVFFFYRVENARSKVYEELIASSSEMDSETAFDLIKHIRKTSRLKQQRWSTLVIVCIFIMFWLLGALVFYFAENWSYFNSLYFCFLCLITIGFGDFAPKSGAGRAFFVVWAICAVPLMTAIISTLGDTLYAMADELDLSIIQLSGTVIEWPAKLYLRARDYFFSTESSAPSSSETNPMEEMGSTSTLPKLSERNISDRRTEAVSSNASSSEDDLLAQKLKEYLEVVQWLRQLSHRKPTEKLSFNDWMRMFSAISDDTNNYVEDPKFWLSSASPLRFPFHEPQYITQALLNKLETDLAHLLEERSKQGETNDNANSG
ncbi:LAME_0A05534g1_1 [Lachancea meyersii CBS 8951]|uniref:LAME_0A05534g1_1 n=1 Tax=Lachancea meyersii CBS 8951 TaxID=1266667 RepID=A0A1G4IQ80_9SACH|nr:LAME_0A05534g1_1 [Lachancea meyersii CBS 8951]